MGQGSGSSITAWTPSLRIPHSPLKSKQGCWVGRCACGHCIKTAHHALLMLVGVLALELLAHRVAELHVRRWVVGRCAAWRALEPLRAPSGRGRLAKRFGGRAWLAHLGYYGRGCAHREREGASSGGKRSNAERQMAGYARKEQRAVVSIRWQDARKECSF